MHLEHMELIALATFFEQEVAAILGDCFRLSALLSNLIVEYPVAENSCFGVDVQLILINT